MAINKNASKIQKYRVLQVTFFSLKFVRIVFISSSNEFITSAHVIIEPSIILAKYFPFLQLNAAGFQI